MATSTDKVHCDTCAKARATYKCDGCSITFCRSHLNEHQQLLIKQLEDLENQRNIFRQTLTEQSKDPQIHSFIQQINRWEIESIKKIQETANETKQFIIQHTEELFQNIEINFDQFTKELKETREEDDFNDIHLHRLNLKLQSLQKQLNTSSNISIQHDSSLFINKIYVIIPPKHTEISNIPIDAKWTQNGITIAGHQGEDNELNQLSNPWGVYVDDNETVYVADYKNHRIMEWKNGATTGQVVAGGNGAGDQNDQLNRPTDVIFDKSSDSLIISDSGNNRVVRWSRRSATNGETIISNINCRETKGTLVAGGNGNGNRLDQLNVPTYIYVDEDHSVYVAEKLNHRVTKWVKGAEEGVVVAGGQDTGKSLSQLSCPFGVIVDRLGTVYVSDLGNDRVMRWVKGAREGTVVVGGKGRGEQPNQLNQPV
ncbi:unnamed protein product, partial [Rotaria sp. Silwood1]